jgi:hypothetical protein
MMIAWRGYTRTRVILAFLSVIAAASILHTYAAAAGKPSSLSEPKVKAAFLFNFIQFIEWPAGAFPDKYSPIVVGIIGDDSTGRALEQSLQNRSISGRDLVLRQIEWPGEIKGVHILLLCASEAKDTASILASLKGNPILTVGETDRFGKLGGIINFYIEENKVRFEINIDAAEKARLKISSQLLSLAKIIRADSHTGRM